MPERDAFIDYTEDMLLDKWRDALDVAYEQRRRKLKVIAVLEGTPDEIDEAYGELEAVDHPAIRCLYESDF